MRDEHLELFEPPAGPSGRRSRAGRGPTAGMARVPIALRLHDPVTSAIDR